MEDSVDPTVSRRLREAYLNDGEAELVVRRVRSANDGAEIVVEMSPPHGEVTHTVRFDGPKHGSLEECEQFLSFLEAAGVSPLSLEELVGTRIPATFDPDHGWQLADAYRPTGDGGSPRLDTTWKRMEDWAKTYRKWLLVVLIVGIELLLVVLLILAFA